jgi:hypothetical protein
MTPDIIEQESLALLRATSILQSIVGYDYAKLDATPPATTIEEWDAQMKKEHTDDAE